MAPHPRSRICTRNCVTYPWEELPLKKLSDPTETPYRETGAAIPLSHCVSCGMADYRCYTPTSFLQIPYRSPKTGLTKARYCRESWPLKPIALYGASHETVSPIAL